MACSIFAIAFSPSTVNCRGDLGLESPFKMSNRGFVLSQEWLFLFLFLF